MTHSTHRQHLPRHGFLILSLLLLGAAAFFGAFTYQLSKLPAANYEVRDDAVVTLSHARNLVDFGFIGVSPSGERIEGFSAPLQFWVAAAVYAATGIDYTAFLRWQTTIGTLVLGAVFAGLLLSTAPQRQSAWRYVFVAIALVASAYILSTSRAFLLWHASGMENVYKTVTLVALLWLLDSMLRTARIRMAGIAVVFAACMARADSVVPVTLLLATFAALWWLRYRGGRGLRYACTALLPWLVYTGWRLWYFGNWEPNTALAQNISMTTRLAKFLQSPGWFVGDILLWTRRVGASFHAFQLAWFVPLLLLTRGHRTALDRCALVMVGSAGCVIQYALFGPARIDVARTVPEFAVFATALVPIVLLGRNEFRLRDLVFGVVMLGISIGIARLVVPDRTEIGWPATWFESNAAEAMALAHQNDIPRPTFANPDLGAVSWRKDLNIIDLGMLGSAITPRIESPGRYLGEFAKPDIIEIHDYWSCRYRDLFVSQAFLDDYIAVRAVRTAWHAAYCADAPTAASGLWIRRAVMKDNASRERTFLDAFRQTLDPIMLRAELTRCLNDPGPRPCAYVGRTLFRFVPELKRQGRYAAIASLLREDRRLAVEHAYFTSSVDPLWWRQVLASFEPFVVTPREISLFTMTDGTRSSEAAVDLRDPLRLGWQVRVPLPGRFRIEPVSGVGDATLRLLPNKAPIEQDTTVDVAIYAGDGAQPSTTFTVRFRSVTAVTWKSPLGFVDTPADPVVVGDDPVVIRGWALDDFDLRHVHVSYVDRSGRTRSLGEVHPSFKRPDVAAVYPNGHDIFNSGWAFTLEPGMLFGVARPITLYFVAQAADGRSAGIGTRTIVGDP
jgi:hypothetical protein